VLRAHGRPLPDRTLPGRPGQQDGDQPRALLIQATRDDAVPPASRPAPAAPDRAGGKPGRRDQAGTVLVAEVGLSGLLSQALVAFTIEFDNESERQVPHRTT
jgi:hypothetical protein